MRVEPLGESALILRELPVAPYLAAKRIAHRFQSIFDVAPAYETVGVYFEGTPPSEADLLEAVSMELGDEAPRHHVIPVCYAMGEDLEDAAYTLGLPTETVASLHSSKTYSCAAIGFCPGFPYLQRLDERISGLPRRAAPRVRVEPGSVAITGAQTGIYPLPRPGGWWLIGRTPLVLVDVESGYFPISAGDSVAFRPIGEAEFERLNGGRL